VFQSNGEHEKLNQECYTQIIHSRILDPSTVLTQNLSSWKLWKWSKVLDYYTLSQVPAKKDDHWYSHILIDDKSKNTLRETLGSPVQHPVSKTLVWKPEFYSMKLTSLETWVPVTIVRFGKSLLILALVLFGESMDLLPVHFTKENNILLSFITTDHTFTQNYIICSVLRKHWLRQPYQNFWHDIWQGLF